MKDWQLIGQHRCRVHWPIGKDISSFVYDPHEVGHKIFRAGRKCNHSTQKKCLNFEVHGTNKWCARLTNSDLSFLYVCSTYWTLVEDKNEGKILKSATFPTAKQKKLSKANMDKALPLDLSLRPLERSTEPLNRFFFSGLLEKNQHEFKSLHLQPEIYYYLKWKFSL